MFPLENTRVVQSFAGPYWFLSNSYPALVVLDGVTYPTVEHAYQAAKTRPDCREQFRHGTPEAAKYLGKKVVLRPGWASVQIPVMTDLIAQKFGPLSPWLIATFPAKLAEGNWWGDTFWGTVNGRGLDHLGRILMARREQIMPPRSFRIEYRDPATLERTVVVRDFRSQDAAEDWAYSAADKGRFTVEELK
jgi:predicted NAD-dependent protein-ADP-ribosyltransferase YbiA (DUF1768 family)